MGIFSLILDIIQQIFSGPRAPEPIPDSIKRDLDPPKDNTEAWDNRELGASMEHAVKVPEAQDYEERLSMVNWNDLNSPISRHFKVKEAIWFPQWNRAATEADGLTEEVKKNLIETFKKMDTIRDYIGKPITVHVAFRSKDYNALVKGAKASAHLSGKAVDWSANMGMASKGENCDKIREMLEPCLEEWNLRMEDNGLGATWVHNDTAPVISNRYFKP